MRALLISFGLFITTCALVSDMEPEPQCYSRFDYEYKVVQKLFELEQGAKEQRTINKALEKDLESTKSGIEQRLGILENKNEQLNIYIEDMKIVNEGLKNEVHAMKAQLLELKGKHRIVSLCVLLNITA